MIRPGNTMSIISSIQNVTIQYHDTVRDNIFENISITTVPDSIIEPPSLKREPYFNGPEEIHTLVPTLPTEYHFGIINILVQETPMNRTPIFVLFSNDISGSMNECCADGSTKMEHSIHTIRNILILFANQSDEIDIWVQVNGFDDKIDKIIPAQKVTTDNLDMLLGLLKKMRPRNGTNIELAMRNANAEMRQFHEEHPDFIISHIFTTDGNANVGSCDALGLSGCVDSQFLNTFIGFGYDHSAKILNAMANNKNAQYYFIDNIENGGLVFGEIIHTILYRALTDVVINVKGGDGSGCIYNYKTNTWDKTITVGSLTGEANKVYHLRCSSPDDLILEVTGVNVCITNQDFIETATLIEPTDLSKYLFRQRTQELLYESQQEIFSADFKSRVNQHLVNLKRYMELFQLTKEPFFVGLHDDIVIIINTNGTEYSEMFTIARANTNGRGLSYNVSDVPTIVPKWNGRRMPKRQHGRAFFGNINTNTIDYNDGDDEDDEHYDDTASGPPTRMLSSSPLNRAYSTPRQIEVMRSCSQPMSVET